MNIFDSALRLLSDRPAFIAEIQDRKQLNQKIASLLLSSFIFFALYGLIIGSFHSWLQAISSAIKLPALYLLTLMICMPTLYIFNGLFGSKRSLAQHFTFLLSAAAIIALLLCGFAPITFFFLTTVTAADYSFFLLLNVAILALTGLFGVLFLYRVMKPGEEETADPSILKLRKTILRGWLLLYGFVGSQLGWTLRPFFGSTGTFELFRPRDGNFLTGVGMAIARLFGG
ncbi:MAG: hypothetical protein HC824_09050 [Synechococcales cyanobacterium RM1_1_8]|nr:hypothetical protein [Synechococcales cyanobacterium RM1_1_8]